MFIEREERCNGGLGIKAKKCLYEGAETWGMRSDERRKMNVLEMKCSRNLVAVSPMGRVRNEEVSKRDGIERELASRAYQRVLRWFGHVERMDELMAEVSGVRYEGDRG